MTCALRRASLVLAAAACKNSATASDATSIVNYARRQVAIRTAELGERIAVCDKKEKTGALPDIDYAKLTGMHVTKQ